MINDSDPVGQPFPFVATAFHDLPALPGKASLHKKSYFTARRPSV
jgi:hypothetical protein